MLLFKEVDALKIYLEKRRREGLLIGYVPTMGALHQGHASLVEQSASENALTVCSIFVNPTQFNDPKDLAKYPRTEAADIKMLVALGVDVLFYPSVEAIYPKDLEIPVFDFGQMDKVMEGYFRPGHFDGVVEVVYRLLDIVQPNHLYMGQKDFQQFTLIQHMLQQAEMETSLVVCPIIREADGLALSSRNVRLTPENRANAPMISKTLQQLNAWLDSGLSISEVIQKAVVVLNESPEFKVEYLEIVDGRSLQPIVSLDDTNYAVACVAVWVGNIRLIDNVILKQE
ncbi:MAG: pantoate--beta-alanine ligase [Bacteroidota bacterium]